jgi:hypothetical protein
MAGGTITWSEFDLRSATPATPIANGSLTIASVLFDTLIVNDARWTEDNTGWNFGWLAPGSLFIIQGAEEGPGEVRFEIIATPAAGSAFALGAWQIQIAEMMTYGFH